jgi:hypothetical protein
VTDPAGGRVVTQDDVDLVLESMIRRETGWLRQVGWAAEVLGWLGIAGALVWAFVQWDSLDSFSDPGGNAIERWRSIVGFLLPSVLNLSLAGIVAVVLGRGARLFALHQAARRGINVSGLTIGEPIDVPAEEDDRPWT